MTDKEPVKLTTTNTLQSEENPSRKNCNIQNFVPPDGGSRVRYFLTYVFCLQVNNSQKVPFVYSLLHIFSHEDIFWKKYHVRNTYLNDNS